MNNSSLILNPSPIIIYICLNASSHTNVIAKLALSKMNPFKIQL